MDYQKCNEIDRAMITSISYHPTTIENKMIKTQIKINNYTENFWMLGELNDYDEGDFINLRYIQMTTYNYTVNWITSINKLEVKSIQKTKKSNNLDFCGDCKCIMF